MKKIASWNVNGIRACAKKGLLDWIEKSKYDVICFQEIKALNEQIPSSIKEHPDYNSHFFPAKKPGYSGVGLMWKKNITLARIQNGLGIEKFDQEGRLIKADFGSYILYNGYYPNGQRDHNRVPYKLEFSELVALDALEEIGAGRKVILTGDFNTAHHPIDLKNPKTNLKTTGFLPEERAWMDTLVERGIKDCFRHLHPNEEGHYTWWTYRNGCRARNIGWRIDYFFTHEADLNSVKKCYHRPEVMGSDHCPVVLELAL